MAGHEGWVPGLAPRCGLVQTLTEALPGLDAAFLNYFLKSIVKEKEAASHSGHQVKVCALNDHLCRGAAGETTGSSKPERTAGKS